MRKVSNLIEQAELIVFVEADNLKFLNYFPETQSKNIFDALMRYITTTAPTQLNSYDL